MKKLKILCLVLCLALAVLCCFTACGEEENAECMAHIDETGDKKCDNCGMELNADVPPDPPIKEDPTEEPTADEPATDEPEISEEAPEKPQDSPTTEEPTKEPTDEPTDEPTNCTEHSDNDMDRKCDYCEESFMVECSSHIDVDGNHRCDYCRALKTEKCIEPIDVNGDQNCDMCGAYYNAKSILLIINDRVQPFGAFMEFYQGLAFGEGGRFLRGEDYPGYATHALFPLVDFLELLGIESKEDEECVLAKKGDKTVTIYKSLPVEMYEGEKEKQNWLPLAQVEERAIGKTVDGVFLVSDEPISYIAKYFGFKFHFNAAFDLRVVDCFIECPDDADHKCELCELYPAVECGSHLDFDGDFKCDKCESICSDKTRLFVAGNEISEGQYIQFYNGELLLDSSKPIKREEVTKIMVPMIAMLKAIGAEITENTETYVEFNHRARSYRLEKGERLALINLSTNENDMRGDGAYISVETDVLVDYESLRQTLYYNFGEYWDVFFLYSIKAVEYRCYIVWE